MLRGHLILVGDWMAGSGGLVDWDRRLLVLLGEHKVLTSARSRRSSSGR